MLDVASLLATNPNGVLATCDGQRPHTRVFQALFLLDGNVYFCTSTEKEACRQLMANPWASFCTHTDDYDPVLSLSGPVTFVDDPALKARALAENPGIKSIYHSPDNPVLRLFFLTPQEVRTFTFALGTRVQRR